MMRAYFRSAEYNVSIPIVSNCYTSIEVMYIVTEEKLER